MEYGLGIDFGTTFSAAAISTPRGVEICTLGTRAAAIPTVVLVREDGEVLVGEAAERRALQEPHRAAFAFKRRLGDPTPLVLGDAPYGAETLTGYVLSWIVRQVTQQNGAPPARIVLSHPAPFGDYKLDLLRLAARQADIGPVSFISEPEAAAVHYSTLERIEVGQVVAIYDFGGGTFDAALLRKTERGFDLIGQPEGLERIGGIDLDHAVLQHVMRSIGLDPSTIATDDPEMAAALARLREDCRNAKEALSSDADVTVPVTFPNLRTHVRLTRVEFEAMIRPRIADTVEALQRAVRSAGLEMGAVDRILLVGGTSRVPLIREMVREATGRPVALDVHPKHSVAMGAAALAGATVTAASPAPAFSPPAQTPTVAAPPPPPSPVPPVPPLAASAPVSPPPPIAPAAGGRSPEEPPTKPKRRLALLAGALVVVAAAVVAAVLVLGGKDKGAEGAGATTSAPVDTPAPGADTTTPGAETTAPSETSGAPADSSGEEPLAATLPRQATYGGVDVSFDRLFIRTQDPGSYEAGADPLPEGPRWAFVQGQLTNHLTNVPIGVSATTFTLQLADGTELAGTQVEAPSQLGPGETQAIVLGFELGDVADFAGSSIRIGDNGDEPATVPLDGDPPAPASDITVATSASFTVTGAGGFPSDWVIGDGRWSLDAAFDSADYAGGQSTADRRAAVGSRWLNVEVTITAGSCDCQGVQVDASMVRLQVDGSELAPVNGFSEYLAPGTSFDVILGFEVPAASAVTLQVGPAGQPDATQSVDVPLQ
jgi:actin-like ATPase involved in cell morphogenesis